MASRRVTSSLVLATPLVVLLATLSPVSAAAGERTFQLEAHDNGYEFWFQEVGSATRNPMLEVAAGERVVVTLVNRGTSPHNFHVGAPVDEGWPPSPYLPPGGEITFDFTVPDGVEGDLRYYCHPHRGLLMGGILRVAAAPGDQEVAPAATPGAPAALGVLAVALVALVAARRR